jgi:hypothetical protein
MFGAMGMLVGGGAPKIQYTASGVIAPSVGNTSLTLPDGVRVDDVLIAFNPFDDRSTTPEIAMIQKGWMTLGRFNWMYDSSLVMWRAVKDPLERPSFRLSQYGWTWVIYRNALSVIDVVNAYQSPMGADFIDIAWPAKGQGVRGLVALMADRDPEAALVDNAAYKVRHRSSTGAFATTIADRLEVPAGEHTDRFATFFAYYGQAARGLELRGRSAVPYDVTTPPAMDFYSTAAGYQALASTETGLGNGAPWRAFDGSTGTWMTATDVAWLQIRFPTERKVLTYKIKVQAANFGPTTFSLQGSVDGRNFTTLDVQISEPTWTAHEEREYTIAVPAPFFYLRLDVTDNSAFPVAGSEMALQIEELSFTYDDGTTIPFPVDIQPAAFSFTDVSGAAVSTPYTSNSITVSEIEAPSPITVSGGEYSINGGPFTSDAGTVVNLDTVRARGTSSASFAEGVGVTVSIGGMSDTFTITTAAAEDAPDAFSFTDVTGAALSTDYESNTITVEGITTSVAVTITGGEYSKNGAAYTSAAGTAASGDTFKVKGMSSGSFSTALNIALTIGGVSDTYSVTTGASDTAPSAFTFVDKTLAALSTSYESNEITVAGINAPATMTITGGQYRKNGGAWASTSTTVVADDVVQVRGTSSASNATDVDVVLTIGGVSDTYSITTISASVVAKDAQSVTIRDSAPLNSVDGNGWVADVNFKGMVVGGTGDVSGAKALTIEVDSPGYDATGASTTVSRTIYGTIPLRKPTPDHTEHAQETSGSDAVISFALDSRIYGSCSVTSASIGAGAYVQGANSSNAVSVIATLLNSSSLGYPLAVCAWAQPHRMRATGSTFHVEYAVTHPFGMNLRMAACVEFRVETLAGVDQGISVKVDEMTASTYLTGGNPVPVFAADIDLTGLSQGVEYKVRAKTYPWIGNVVHDTGLLPDPLTVATLTSLHFLCDKAGTYGSSAWVKVGAVGGMVGSNATPYSTIAAAAAALRVAHNAKASPNQHDNSGGGVIYLMETTPGGGADHAGMGLGTMGTSSAGSVTFLDIRPDPDATGVVRVVTGAQKNPGANAKFHGIRFMNAVVAGNSNDLIMLNALGNTTNFISLWLDGCSYAPSSTASVTSFAQAGMTSITNCEFNTVSRLFAPTGNVKSQYTLIGGNKVYGSTSATPFTMLGNIFYDGCGVSDTSAATVLDANDGKVIVANSFFKQGSAIAFGSARVHTTGAGIAQNLIEYLTGLNQAENYSADSCSNNVDNVVDAFNTAVGARSNKFYSASGVTAGTRKRGISRFNLMWHLNIKSDAFATENEGAASGADRTGNWEYRHAVDNFGNVNTDGDDNGGLGPNYASWDGEQLGRGGATGQFGVTFADPQDLSVAGVGGGDYHLTGGSNPAYDRVPAGMAMFPFGLDGAPWLNDGSDPCGCYPR